MSNPNPSPENRFKPGQTGNAKGAKGPRFATKLKIYLSKRVSINFKEFGKTRGTCDDIICMKAIAQAMKGDKEARKWISENVDGKPKQTIDMPSVERHNNLLYEIVKRAQKHE